MTCGEKKNINENGEGVHKELQFGQGCFHCGDVSKKGLEVHSDLPGVFEEQQRS